MTAQYSVNLLNGTPTSFSPNYTVGRKGSFSKDVFLRSLEADFGSGTAYVRVWDFATWTLIGEGSADTAGGRQEISFTGDVLLTAGVHYVVGYYNPGMVEYGNNSAPRTINSSPTFCTWTGDNNLLYYIAGNGTPTNTNFQGSLDAILRFDATNSAPNAPIPTAPANNATVDRSQPITLAATFSDPNAGDSPSASQWRFRTVGAATWTTVTQNNPLQSYAIPAGLAAGDYEWQAAYADQAGAWGPFCGSAFFTAADPPPGPTIIDPAAGATIGASSYTFVISTPSLDESEWTLYADDGAGNIDTNTILQGPVSVTTGDLRRHEFTGLANNVPIWLSVRDKDNGLWTQPVQQRYPVSYTPPATPTVTLTPYSDAGLLDVGITNPPPGTGEPAVSYNDVYVDDGQGLGWERVATMLAPSTGWTYELPRSGYEYSGHVKVRAIASNGTTSEAIA